jgi:hypothetical protein
MWGFGLGGLYQDSKSITHYRANQYLKSWAWTAGFNRRLFNDAWSLNAYYAYLWQSQNYIGFPGKTSANGVGFSIRYGWNHSLGR